MHITSNELSLNLYSHYPVDKKGNITWPENVQEMR